MSDQQVPEEGAPEAVDTPQGTEEQQVNWEDRYKEAQAWGTQNAQRAAELERYERVVQGLHSEDAEERRQAAEALGFQFDDEPDEDDGADPYAKRLAEYERRIAEQEARWEQFTTQAQQAEVEQRDLQVISEGLDALQTTLGRKLTQEEIGLLGDAAWSNRDEQGLPNIAAVTETYKGIAQAQAPKPRPKAPQFSSVGREGTQTGGAMTHEQRVERAMERLASGQ